MKRMILVIMLALTAGTVGTTLAMLHTDKPVPAQVQIKTKNQPFKTRFLADCESAGGKATEITCGCAYGQLVTLYGDNWESDSNKAVVQRIEAQGVNQTEASAIAHCVRV